MLTNANELGKRLILAPRHIKITLFFSAETDGIPSCRASKQFKYSGRPTTQLATEALFFY